MRGSEGTVAPGGFLDRMMRSSVDRALRLQPTRSLRLVNETRFATGPLRDHLEDLRRAGSRLVAGTLAVPALAGLALRLPNGRVVATVPHADLTALDERHLDICDPGDLAEAATRAGAAVVAHPYALLALGATGRLPDPAVSKDLAEATGTFEFGPPSEPGVGILVQGTVIASGATAVECVIRMEAAERLALVTLERPDQEESWTEPKQP